MQALGQSFQSASPIRFPARLESYLAETKRNWNIRLDKSLLWHVCCAQLHSAAQHFWQNCYMDIGIIGSGKMGTGLGRLWAKHGHHVRVAVRWTWSGTHTGNLLGIAPTNRKIEFTETHLLRISGGRIAEDHVSANLLDLLDQLGTTQFAAA